MNFAEMCGKCHCRLVVSMLDGDKPHYVCCTDSGVYKAQMRKIDYDTLEKTFAFSPNTGTLTIN